MFTRVIRLWVLVVALLALSSVPQKLQAARPALPGGFSRIPVVTGLDSPTAMAIYRDRIFVTEKDSGRVLIARRSTGAIRSTPFVTVGVTNDGERGLLGIALDPHFRRNHFVYLYYTTGPGALGYDGVPKIRVSRFSTVNGVGANEKILLQMRSKSGYHNGGGIHFGFDGKLYLSIGENHSSLSNNEAQDLSSRRGKVLRINSDGTIPTDNPFYNTPGAAKSVYAYGFRNPFRFSLRRSNHTYIVADVGQVTWEELDSLQPGKNYGWPQYEGPCPSSNVNCNPGTTNFGSTIRPIHYYNHSVGQVIIGGAFAERNSNYPGSYNGAFFYGDHSEGWVNALTMDSNNNVLSDSAFDSLSTPVDFVNGPDGNVYVMSLGLGAIYKYVYTP